MQKAETDDVILILFFLYKGGFAIVRQISRWVCGNEPQCKNLALDTWVSSKLSRKALSVPFNSCSSICVCMCKPRQWLSTFKCRSLCYFSAPRLVIPDNNFICYWWKNTKNFPALSAYSLVIPFFWCSSPSSGDFLLYAMLRRFLFNFIFELLDSLSVMLRLQRERESRFLFELLSCSLK